MNAGYSKFMLNSLLSECCFALVLRRFSRYKPSNNRVVVNGGLRRVFKLAVTASCNCEGSTKTIQDCLAESRLGTV